MGTGEPQADRADHDEKEAAHAEYIGWLAEQKYPHQNCAGGANAGPDCIGGGEWNRFERQGHHHKAQAKRRTKLRPSAAIVASVGHSRVRPAEYLSPIAQVISNNPARSRACHPFTCYPITCHLFMGRIASVESHRVCAGSLLAVLLVTCVK